MRDRWLSLFLELPVALKPDVSRSRQDEVSRWWIRVGWALSLSLVLILTACQGEPIQPAWGSEQKLLAEAWTYVDRAYVDPEFNGQNWWQVRQDLLSQSLPDRQTTYRAIESMLALLEDPFTRFLDPDQYQQLQTSTAGELNGVGLQIAIDDQLQVVVIAPIEGSPAERAGLQSGDLIIEVDRVSVEGFTLDEVADRMRGPMGSAVELTIQRNQQTFSVTLTRESIDLNSVRSQQVTDPETGELVTYVRLSQFNGKAAQQLRDIVETADVEPVEGYVLDLRNNPGGLLQAAIEIGQMLIDRGDIVLVTTRNGVQDSIATTPERISTKPWAVLVNSGSASASEVLAGALQDSGHGILVGTQTFGKGLIQSLFELDDGSGLAITTAKYLTPKGRDINKQGIEPDIQVALPADAQLTVDRVATEADVQFSAALEVLRTQRSDLSA